MADFTSEFWNLYIVVLTVIGIVGCGVLLWSQSSVKGAALKSVDGKVGTTGHIWDEDLTELNTPMPRWWMWLFYLTIAFAIGYLWLYPGLGSYKGSLGWTSAKEHKEELAKAEKEYGPLFDKYKGQDLKSVAADPQARAIGERLFLTYCAQCHGSDARGNKGFPNLADKDWLHGGDPDTIKLTIMKGRHGVMPPMGAAVGSEKDIENVAQYVLSLSDSTSDPIKSVMGRPKFAACMACHGAGGKGNPMLGAPNLSDKTWLYGGSAESIMETIRKGRNNTMPAFEDFLGEGKVHVLAAYVWGLSNPPVTAMK
ncbi:cytochrome-c oxidase, cbb3-type subunit III [Pseudoduganella violaceinigra]|uniref:cytochrome-c oxidase, cbb3-type subunit III n=1 Tax=Pseudoduganella violaceinigra TaxID=246602 RepID=UPI0004112A75|nr:cytochrome-c oxidase, cbb3-type subunit III [Pseudoduganella violaceinigra]